MAARTKISLLKKPLNGGSPTIDNEATVDFVYRQAAQAGKANVFAVGAITKSREGKELAEMGQMVRGGAVAFTDDGSGVQDPAMMHRGLWQSFGAARMPASHCAGKGSGEEHRLQTW